MTSPLPPLGRRAAFFGVAAAAVYCTMIFGSLSRLEMLAGEAPFDMRPMGYSPEEARALLSSLGESGRATYAQVQLVLDTLYPALMALTLACLFRLVGHRTARPRTIRVGILVSWMAAVFDYAENVGIAAMLAVWPKLPDWLVQFSSLATVAKSLLTSAAVAGLLGLAGLWYWRHWQAIRQSESKVV